jgi:hypothetical protein
LESGIENGSLIGSEKHSEDQGYIEHNEPRHSHKERNYFPCIRMDSRSCNIVTSNDLVNLILLQHNRSVDRTSNILSYLVLCQLFLTFFDSFIRVEKQPTLISVHVNLTRD